MKSIFFFLATSTSIISSIIIISSTTLLARTNRTPRAEQNHLTIKNTPEITSQNLNNDLDDQVSNNLSECGINGTSQESFNEINDDQKEKSKKVFIFGDLEVTLIVNLAKTLWDVFESAKPTGIVTSAQASALPPEASCWNDLTGWQHAPTKTYHVRYKNLLNVTIINFSYQISYLYNGSFKEKGKYLTGIRIVPKNLEVGWGYAFESNVLVPSIINLGTRENPIAGASIHVEWSVSSPMTSSLRSNTHFIRGDGQPIKVKTAKVLP